MFTPETLGAAHSSRRKKRARPDVARRSSFRQLAVASPLTDYRNPRPAFSCQRKRSAVSSPRPAGGLWSGRPCAWQDGERRRASADVHKSCKTVAVRSLNRPTPPISPRWAACACLAFMFKECRMESGEQNGRLTSSVAVILKIATRHCGRRRRALGGQWQLDIFALVAAARHETLALKCNVSVVVWLHNSG